MRQYITQWVIFGKQNRGHRLARLLFSGSLQCDVVEMGVDRGGGQALRMTPEFWLNLQNFYDLDAARGSNEIGTNEPLVAAG